MANPETTGIPQDLAEKATEAMARAFDLFKTQLEMMTKDSAELEEKKLKIEERIRRGARRSNGPIV